MRRMATSRQTIFIELTTEKITGGLKPVPGDFKYHVGVIGKHNNSNTRCLACSAGIISDYHAIGNAECFFDSYTNEMMKLRFYVILGSLNLKCNVDNAIDVIKIYSYTNAPLTNKHYIAILQLKDRLHLNVNGFRYASLVLPPEDIIYNLPARVAGYGLKTMKEKMDYTGKARPKFSANKDFFLTYLDVEIVDGENCRNSYKFIHSTQEFCGLVRGRPLERRGLCTYDEGAPLVIGDELVVGVAHRNRYDCDNTIEPQLYTKVTFYLKFIRGVRDGEPIENTVAHYNRPWENNS